MHEMPLAAVDTDQQSLAQLSAGPCADLTTRYVHTITLVTYVQVATEDYYVNITYTENCKMADIIEVSKKHSSFLTKYF